MSQYNYTKTIDIDRLTLEINQSTITIALDYISALSTSVSIFFKADLSDSEKNILDLIVANHIPTPLPSRDVVVPDVAQDTEKAQIFRPKYGPSGWTFQERCFDFETSSLYLSNFDENKNTLNDCIVRLYNSSNTLLNKYNQDGSPIIDDPSYSATVKTVVDLEPQYDFEIIGGYIMQEQVPTEDVFMNVVMAPYIPYAQGGSRVLIKNKNLFFFSVGEKIFVDGRTSKKLTYNPTYHSNLMRLIIYHPAGYKSEFMSGLEHFKL